MATSYASVELHQHQSLSQRIIFFLTEWYSFFFLLRAFGMLDFEALSEVPFGASCVIDSEDSKVWAEAIKNVWRKKRKT